MNNTIKYLTEFVGEEMVKAMESYPMASSHKQEIVTICSSVRLFHKEITYISEILILKGYIVFTPIMLKGENQQSVWNDNLQIFVNQHMKKIDMSDRVFILDIDDYIGKTVLDELVYAKSQDKKVDFYSRYSKRVSIQSDLVVSTKTIIQAHQIWATKSGVFLIDKTTNKHVYCKNITSNKLEKNILTITTPSSEMHLNDNNLVAIARKDFSGILLGKLSENKIEELVSKTNTKEDSK